MKTRIVAMITVLSLFGVPGAGMAGMNHQPHNTNTFMKKERRQDITKKEDRTEDHDQKQEKKEKKTVGGQVKHYKHRR